MEYWAFSADNQRCKKVKSFFDKLIKDAVFSDPLQEFKVNVFYTSFDIVISNIQMFRKHGQDYK